MQLNTYIHTDGSGLWSNTDKRVKVTKLEAVPVDEDCPDFGEVRVHFNVRSWDVQKYGLIYTDNRWLRELKNVLRKQGFSAAAVKELDYSEQGMQGVDYVSLDCGEKFLDEYMTLEIGATC